MTVRRLCIPAAVGIASLMPVAMDAQKVSCTPAMSINDCYAATVAAKPKTSSKPTGNEVHLTQTQTAIKDFLPTIASAASIHGLSTDPTALGLRFNLGRNNDLWSAPFTLQLESVANMPSPYDSLISAVAKARQSAVKDSLTTKYGAFDDLTHSVALNLETTTLGRSFAPHIVEISRALEPIYQKVAAGVGATYTTVAMQAQRDPAKAANVRECGKATNLSDIPMSCLSNTTDIISLIGQAVSEAEKADKVVHDEFVADHSTGSKTCSTTRCS
jgi:hypothetical protein